MKKILATLAGTLSLALAAGACSAVDTEPKSIAPIATVSASPNSQLLNKNYDRLEKPTRSATRPVKKTPSAHELHVKHVRLVSAANRAARANAKAVAHVKAIKIANAKAHAKKLKKQKKVVVKTKKPKGTKVGLGGIAACIAKYESGGNPRAQNPHSSASGLFQFIDGTWNHFGGYARAMYAPVSVQLKKFYIVWDGGRGAGNWVVRHKCGW